MGGLIIRQGHPPNAFTTKPLTKSGKSVLPENLPDILEKHPELALLIQVWPTLSVEIRDFILTATKGL